MRWPSGKLLGLALAGVTVVAQTKVSLRDQVREYDLSRAVRVRPVPVLQLLPETCAIGELVFRDNVPAGENLYGCTSANTWSAIGLVTVFDAGIQVLRTQPTHLTLGSDCNVQRPCRFRFGSVVQSRQVPATLTVSSGNGQVFLYITPAGQFGVAQTPVSSLVLSCSGCVIEATTTSFPLDSIPLWSWTATSGTWDSTGGIDYRTTLVAGRRLVAGANSMVTETGDTLEISTTNYLPQGAVVSGNSLRLGGSAPVSGETPLLGAGSTLSGGAAQGTMLGMNGAGGYSGDLAHWQVGGTSRFRWTAAGEYSGHVNGGTSRWWGNAASSPQSSFRLAIAGTTASEKLQLGTGLSGNFLQANGLNRIGIGTAAPEPGDADLLVQDARSGTGDTQVQIRGGEGQARDLLQVQSFSGTVLTAITAEGALRMQPQGAKPLCEEARRGQIWFVPGGVGVADQLEICVKDAADAYQWNGL